MAEDWPKIKSRHTTRVSPWMAIIEREVEFVPGAECEIYHAVSQQDYIAIVAALPDSRIPIVRQYRPALENFTWELPAGLLDPGEDAAACCRRELMERLVLPPAPCMRWGPMRPARRGCRIGCIPSTSSLTRSLSANQPSRESSSSW